MGIGREGEGRQERKRRYRIDLIDPVDSIPAMTS